MAIFITGASGFIGGSLARHFIDAGYTVRGLVRSESKAEQLKAMGIEPVLGTLDDSELLTREARASEGVINAADSDHLGAIDAFIEGLQGTGRPLIHTSGSSVIGDDVGGNALSPNIFDEDTPLIVEPKKAARHAIDERVRAAASQGIRSIVLCNTMIYGTGRGLHPDSVQIPPLVNQARKNGVVRVVGQGINRWSNVHIDDVVALYLLAFENAPAGSFYFVENGEASYAEIGAAIARRLNLGPVQSWTVDEAALEWGRGHAQYSFGSNSRVRAKHARSQLGWKPTHTSITAWIENEMPLASA